MVFIKPIFPNTIVTCLGILAMNDCKKKCVGLQSTLVSKRTVILGSSKKVAAEVTSASVVPAGVI